MKISVELDLNRPKHNQVFEYLKSDEIWHEIITAAQLEIIRKGLVTKNTTLAEKIVWIKLHSIRNEEVRGK